MTRRVASPPISPKAAAAAEQLRLLLAVTDAHQPSQLVMSMCARALDLYYAAEATGEPGFIDPVGRLVGQLVRGILLGVTGQDADSDTPLRFDA